MLTIAPTAEQPQRPPLLRVRIPGASFRVNIRVLGILAVTLFFLASLATWAVTLGSFPLSLSEVYGALVGSGTAETNFIVLDLRLPRILTAMLVGPMLAMSGAIFQGLVRNPLVSPDIIGINAGAAVAAVFWIVTGLSVTLLPPVAFVGALAAAAAVYLLSWRGRMSASRLVLVGVGINAVLTACITFLVVRAEINDASRAILWLTGSVYSSDWGDVRVLAGALTALSLVGVVLIWSLRTLHVGDLTARSVGMPLERTRLALIGIGCALSAFAVAVAGPIGFVALMSPHLARMVAGPMSGSVFLLAGAIGALIVLGADIVGQHALPINMPAGVLTAAVGAPYFLFLLYRTNTRL